MTAQRSSNNKKPVTSTYWAGVKFGIATTLLCAFLYWVDAWWGLIVVPFLFDLYFTHKINWGWWREPEVGPVTRFIMSWVDAIVFALVAIYFLNQFFFQNFVIPSSSLEKTLLTGDYLLVSKLSYGPRIPQTPLTMPLTQHTLPIFNCKSYLEKPHWEYRRVKGLGHVQLNDIVVFNYPAGDTVAVNQQNQDYYRMAYQMGDELLGTARYATGRSSCSLLIPTQGGHELRTATSCLPPNLCGWCGLHETRRGTIRRNHCPPDRPS